MKTNAILALLLSVMVLPACYAKDVKGLKLDFDHIKSVYIKRGVYTWTTSGIISGHEVLIRFDKLLLLGLNPTYNSKTGEITLISTRYQARGKLGSTLIKINNKLERLYVAPQFINYPKSGYPAPQLYVPVLRIAKSLGYKVTDYKATVEWPRHFDIVAQYYHMALSDFKSQVIISPLTQRFDDLQATASLITDAERATEDPEGNKLIIKISIFNMGKRPYCVAREFVYLEQWNGFIADTYYHRLMDAMVVIPPKGIGTINIERSYDLTDNVPIRRIIYLDGRYRFEWQVAEKRK